MSQGVPRHVLSGARFLLAIGLWLAIPWSDGQGAVWHVRSGGSGASDGRSWSSAFAHPAQAAAVAKSGDDIWVAQGIYTGDQVRMAAGVRLIGGFVGVETEAGGSGRDPALTTLTLGGAWPAIVINGRGATNQAVIAGVTLKPREGATTTARGLVATNVVLSVEQCRFEGFRAITDSQVPGSALSMNRGQLAVTGCTFTRNVALGTPGSEGYGAAIGVVSAKPLLVRSNTFAANQGGSATCLALNYSEGEVSDNHFIGNTASTNAVPGAVELFESVVAVLRNRFLFNRSGIASSIFVFDGRGGRTHRLEFNLFVGGSTSGGSGPRGAVSCWSPVPLRVVNNTFVGNTDLPLRADRRDGPVAATDPRGITVANNLFVGHPGTNACTTWPLASRNLVIDIDSDSYRSLRELGVEDELADREIVGGVRGFSFRLAPEALSRGFGNPDAVAPGSLDAAGRPVPHPDGSVDVGAFAFVPGEVPIAPRILHVRPDGNDAASGNSWAEAMRTLAAAISRVDLTRPTELWLAGGSYNTVARTNPIPPNLAIRGGFAGTELSLSERPAPGTVTSRLVRGDQLAVISLEGNGPWNEFDRLEFDLSGTRLRSLPVTAAFLASGAWPWIHHCSFVGVRSSTNVIALQIDAGIVEDCTFSGFDSTMTSSSRALIRIAGLGPVSEFRRNRVEGNQFIGSSVVLGAFGGTTRVSYNLWRSNSVSGAGCVMLGAIVSPNVPASLRIQHNTVLQNVALETADTAGSLIRPLQAGPRLLFAGNLVVSNRGDIRLLAADAAAARDNLVHATEGGVPGNPLDPRFNLSVDPRLAPGDWRLPAGSPAIDAVRSAGPEAFARDLDGQGAWLGTWPDIGADESIPALPQAVSMARATLKGAGLPGSGRVTWSALESACEDCLDRTWLVQDGAVEFRLRSKPGCVPPNCPEPEVWRSRGFDAGPAPAGPLLVRVTIDAAPARTLAVWVPPAGSGRLEVGLADGVPRVRFERHPATPVDLFASPDLVSWQPVTESLLADFVASRTGESWFFRKVDR